MFNPQRPSKSNSEKQSEGKSTSVMDYNNPNESFNTMPALESSNEYFSESSPKAFRNFNIGNFNSENQNKSPKIVNNYDEEKIGSSEFKGIFDYNNQKSESLSTLEELNKKYNLGLKSFVDSELMKSNNDERDQVKVFESQNYEGGRFQNLGKHEEELKEVNNYGDFFKKKIDEDIHEIDIEDENDDADKENIAQNGQIFGNNTNEKEYPTIERKKDKNIFHEEEINTIKRKPPSLKKSDSGELKDLTYANSFGNLHLINRETPAKSVDENSSDKRRSEIIEELNKKCKSHIDRNSVEINHFESQKGENMSEASNDWAPSALKTDPPTPVIQRRGLEIDDIIKEKLEESELNLENEINNQSKSELSGSSVMRRREKSKSRPFLESILKDRETSKTQNLSEKLDRSGQEVIKRSSYIKRSQFTYINNQENISNLNYNNNPNNENNENNQDPFGKFEVIQIAKTLKYIGNTKNGLFHGEGKIITSNGDIIYNGNFENGFYSGFGKLKNIRNELTFTLSNDIIKKFMSISNNNYLSITAKRGILDVNFSEENWISYEGFFKKGQKDGVGKLYLKDGRIFEGEFEGGQANGYGIMSYFEKKVVGKWKDNIILNFL